MEGERGGKERKIRGHISEEEGGKKKGGFGIRTPPKRGESVGYDDVRGKEGERKKKEEE